MGQRFLPFAYALCPVYRYVPFLMLLALIAMGLPALSSAQPSCQPDGDVDQNNSVTAADALLAFQQALSLAQLSVCQRIIADVFPLPITPDGNVTASDALCIFQKALSLPSCLDTLPSSNQPPVVNAGPDQSVDAGTLVILSGTASDADGTIAAYAWAQTGGPAVSLTGAAAATAAFTAPEVTAAVTLTFRLTVRGRRRCPDQRRGAGDGAAGGTGFPGSQRAWVRERYVSWVQGTPLDCGAVSGMPEPV